MNDPGTADTPRPVEERLRAALAARANAVGPADLRPLRPPSAAPHPRRPALPPLRLRGAAVGLLALAAVVALVLLTLHDTRTRPAEPARSPRPAVTTPVPVPVPSGTVRTPVAVPSPASEPPRPAG
ncbi:hypothetical protein FRZ03_07445 [Streptomyces misionensis]|uniref:Uncharacterized protein n=1 Tax=Streptomyces misionensis TaxID=67331 RepID=A0A5C6JZ33_9ACTN|nr:hypothetical protein [Streptomyces misionensis]TWV55531.1 hypothetical protein FRZ03_07445 [Streptomyces misionensis]